MLSSLLLLVVSLAVVTFGAEVLVRGASVLALRAGVSALFVGLTVVGIGTSTPELGASLFATLEGSSGIAVGNVVGSSTFNVCVILGVTALVHPVRVELRAVRKDILVAVGVAGAPLVALAFGGQLTRGVGSFFVAGLVVYLVHAFRVGRRGSGAQRELAEEELRSTLVMEPAPAPAPASSPAPTTWRDGVPLNTFFVLLGLVCLLFGSRWFVGSAVALASGFGMSEQVIGLTVVSAGTSLPELVTSIVAARRRNPDIVVGNVIGSNVFNVLGVLGVCSLVHPQEVSHSLLTVDVPVMIVASVCLLPMVKSGGRISRLEGGLLAAGYAGYLAWLLTR